MLGGSGTLPTSRLSCLIGRLSATCMFFVSVNYLLTTYTYWQFFLKTHLREVLKLTPHSCSRPHWTTQDPKQQTRHSSLVYSSMVL